MFRIGDMIIYGNSGVCRVSAIGTLEMAHADKNRDYYTLIPLYKTETIYTPVDTKVFMRPVLSRAQAEAFIRQIPMIRAKRIETKSLPLLSEQHQMSFKSHNCSDLIQLIKTIYAKTANARYQGKKPAQIGKAYMMM